MFNLINLIYISFLTQHIGDDFEWRTRPYLSHETTQRYDLTVACSLLMAKQSEGLSCTVNVVATINRDYHDPVYIDILTNRVNGLVEAWRHECPQADQPFDGGLRFGSGQYVDRGVIEVICK